MTAAPLAQWPRYLNAVTGLWLIVSAFLWSHTAMQQTNAWVVGASAIGIALLASVAALRGTARALHVALAVWLMASIWLLPGTHMATAWNHALIALAMFGLAVTGAHLMPKTKPAAPRTPRSSRRLAQSRHGVREPLPSASIV